MGDFATTLSLLSVLADYGEVRTATFYLRGAPDRRVEVGHILKQTLWGRLQSTAGVVAWPVVPALSSKWRMCIGADP